MSPGAMAVTGTVRVADGIDIAYYEEGNPDGPTVLLVHGWPDSHRLWDSVAPLLRDRYRLIRVDNRGHGASGVPGGLHGISPRKIADDYAAIIAAVGGGPVHIIGHDWGAVSTWDLVTRPRAAELVATFTAVSGPSLGHVGAWARRRLTRPSIRGVAEVGLALGSFSYSILLGLPGLPRLAVSLGVNEKRWRAQQAAVEKIDLGDVSLSSTFADDFVNGSRIYRSIWLSSYSNPFLARPRHTTVPVQILIGKRDPAIRHQCFADETRWADRVWLRLVDGGHWLPFSHPVLLATAATELIESAGQDEQSAELAQWRMSAR